MAARAPLTFRPLDRSCGERMQAINRACPIEADFTFFFDREPDFFAWPEAVFDRHVYLGGFAGQDLAAYAMLGFSQGWHGDHHGELFYAGDARVLPAERGRGFTQDAGASLREQMPSRSLGYGIIKQGNDRALGAFRRASWPDTEVQLLGTLEVANVLLLRRIKPRAALVVRRARPQDLPAIVALMRRAYEQRLFAPLITEPGLLADAQGLPGFGLDCYYLAFRGDELVGALGAWDMDPVRRTKVLRYGWRGHAIRLAYQAGGLVFRSAAPLPRPGQSFRALTITRMAVPSADPAILGDLLTAVANDHLGRGYHMMHVAFCGDDPLRPAVAPFMVQRFCSDLFVIARGIALGPLRRTSAWRSPYVDLRFI
ncbi:MAG: hypothetical protein JRI68_11390 [Deltaproteobacteria bacterium]|nr:hypothetical protein [Deltaproteobacteria bacterium]